MSWARFLILTLLLCGPEGHAQQRPLLTEDPRILPLGVFVSETGVGYFRDARYPLSGLSGNLLTLGDGGLNVGLGRAEFQLRSTIREVLWVKGPRNERRSDWGDVSLSTKILILDEKGARPFLSFRPTVVLPQESNESGLGLDTMRFFGSVILGKTAGPAFVFGSIGLGIMDDPLRPAAQNDVLAYGFAVTSKAAAGVSVFADVNGFHNTRRSVPLGGEDRGQARAGLRFKWGSRTFDVGAVAGLTGQDPRLGVVAGMSHEIRFRK